MRIPTKPFSVARSVIAGCALGMAAMAAAPASEGYFMQARVTKTHWDGAIDLWLTSVHGLPREEAAATDTEVPQLPKVIITLELKSTRATRRVRNSGLQGARVSLRGKCDEIDRAMRVPVIQVRLDPSQRWQQANLRPGDRATYAGFERIAAVVCAPDAARQP